MLTTNVAGALPVANGGTGGANATAARLGINAPGYYTNWISCGWYIVCNCFCCSSSRAAIGIIVQVQDKATGNIELPDISVASSGDVTITYGASVTANSKQITLIG